MLTKRDVIAFANLDNASTGEIDNEIIELPLIEIIKKLIESLNDYK
ncbi:MAG: hypothetical protein HC836_16805 [Richelia sp. RM2_1_2]|nr:hypothetical protein [Richelia sp. RM2_1_2]